MIKLSELILAVKEQKLSKDQLENYHSELSNLFAQMKMETAELEKEEALFMYAKLAEDSVANRKNEWKASQKGQRLIELDNYCLAVRSLLSSIKSRLYNTY